MKCQTVKLPNLILLVSYAEIAGAILTCTHPMELYRFYGEDLDHVTTRKHFNRFAREHGFPDPHYQALEYHRTNRPIVLQDLMRQAGEA